MAKKAERKVGCYVSFSQGEMDRGRKRGKGEFKKKKKSVAPIILKYLRGC